MDCKDDKESYFEVEDAEGKVLFDEQDTLEEYETNFDGKEEQQMIIDTGTDTDTDTDAITSDEDGEGIEHEISSLVAELELHDGEPSYKLTLHPKDETLIASAGGNDKAVLFRVEEDSISGLRIRIVAELSGHKDTVEHVKFSTDGTFLATGSLDGTVRIWMVKEPSSEPLHVLEGPSEVTWIDWHPNKPIIAAGSSDGTVWIWQVKGREQEESNVINVFSGNSTTSTCGAFTPDGKGIVSGGDGVVLVWKLGEEKASITYGGTGTGTFPKDTALCITIHPTMPIALVGFNDGLVVAIHLNHQKVLNTMQVGEEKPIENVTFIHAATIISIASLSGVLNLYDSNNYKPRTSITNHNIDGITSCTRLGDDSSIAIGCLNGTVSIWDVRSGEEKATFAIGLEDNAVFDILEIPSLKLLLACFDDGKVRIHRL